jgi:1-acyl-sn-glycerol-3-phosphate acyltransferase
MTSVAVVGGTRPHPVPLPASLRIGSPWEPCAPCMSDCLPDAGSLPRISSVRVVARFAGLISTVLVFVLAAVLLPLLPEQRRARVSRAIFRVALHAVGVRLVHRGDQRFDAGPGTGGVLMVANHLSWVDILVLGAVQPMRMVAKRELRDWPILGAVAVRVGTLFVDRAGLRSLPSVVAGAAEALRAGSVVGLFPEGTTWCGAAVGTFRRAGFQAALDAGVPVRPVAQRMRLLDGTPTSIGAFIGDDTLGDSLLRVLRLPGLVVEVDVLPLLVAQPGTDRCELARRAELAIAEVTGVAAPEVSRPPRRLPAVA